MSDCLVYVQKHHHPKTCDELNRYHDSNHDYTWNPLRSSENLWVDETVLASFSRFAYVGLYLGSITSHCWWNEPTCPPELRTNNFNNRFVMNKINRTVNICNLISRELDVKAFMCRQSLSQLLQLCWSGGVLTMSKASFRNHRLFLIPGNF